MTIRVPSETFFKIQAIEAMFPSRNRNEIVSDLLSVAIDELVDSLPYSGVTDDGREIPSTASGFSEFEQNVWFSSYSGPRQSFYVYVNQAQTKATKQEDVDSEQQPVKSALKVIDQQGEAA